MSGHDGAHGHSSSAEFFDAQARTWDEPSKVVRAEAIAAAILAGLDLPPNARGLDVGCGTGLGTWPIADAFAHVTLADSSPGMIDVVGDRIAQRPDPERFEARLLDLAVDRLEPDSFDAIWTVMALHHVSPLAPALASLAAALRPGGTLAVADLDLDPDGGYHAGHAHVAHHGFDRDELAVALAEAGLGSVEFSTVYSVTKTVDGVAREFPIFLALARA